MEDAVPPGVEFQVFDGVDRIPTAEHVVPLEQLVQDNSIKKTAKAQPKEDAC